MKLFENALQSEFLKKCQLWPDMVKCFIAKLNEMLELVCFFRYL